MLRYADMRYVFPVLSPGIPGSTFEFGVRTMKSYVPSPSKSAMASLPGVSPSAIGIEVYCFIPLALAFTRFDVALPFVVPSLPVASTQ